MLFDIYQSVRSEPRPMEDDTDTEPPRIELRARDTRIGSIVVFAEEDRPETPAMTDAERAVTPFVEQHVKGQIDLSDVADGELLGWIKMRPDGPQLTEVQQTDE
jgi:hypothetical protein